MTLYIRYNKLYNHLQVVPVAFCFIDYMVYFLAKLLMVLFSASSLRMVATQ